MAQYPGQPTQDPTSPWQPTQGGTPGYGGQGGGLTVIATVGAQQTGPANSDAAHGTGTEAPLHVPYNQQPQKSAQPVEVYTSAANMTEEEVREALIQYVNQFCCYGSKAAKTMTIENMAPSSALHYQIETFTESRSTRLTWKAYNGHDFVDGPMNGTPPSEWEIPCSPAMNFMSEIRAIEVPHTASVKPCHDCNGMGYNRCHTCHGDGRVQCSSCSGSGRQWRNGPDGQRTQESCSFCSGSGKRRCDRCGGNGRITCSSCRGHRNLKHFLELTVRFINHKNGHILEKTGMPQELIQGVSGVVVFEQTADSIEPISNYPVREIVHESARLVQEHRTSFASMKKLQQRHRLYAVPVMQCAYQWKDKKTCFWVYGNERQVYAPDYPQQCCWGCSVL